MRTVEEMREEDLSPAEVHLALRSSTELCSCGQRREQKPDKEAISIITYDREGYIDKEGKRRAHVKHVWFSLADARPDKRDFCSACRWARGKGQRAEVIERKHRIEALEEKLLGVK